MIIAYRMLSRFTVIFFTDAELVRIVHQCVALYVGSRRIAISGGFFPLNFNLKHLLFVQTFSLKVKISQKITAQTYISKKKKKTASKIRLYFFQRFHPHPSTHE